MRFWVLDALTPLRRFGGDIPAQAELLPPRATYRWRSVEGPFAHFYDPVAGFNPPDGVPIQYWLTSAIKGEKDKEASKDKHEKEKHEKEKHEKNENKENKDKQEKEKQEKEKHEKEQKEQKEAKEHKEQKDKSEKHEKQEKEKHEKKWQNATPASRLDGDHFVFHDRLDRVSLRYFAFARCFDGIA